MTDKLVIIINSLKVPKIKKLLLYEMKFLVPNYSCLQNPWLGGRGLLPPDPRSLSPTEFVEPPPRTKFLGMPLRHNNPEQWRLKVRHVVFRYFPENWRLWKRVVLYSGKYGGSIFTCYKAHNMHVLTLTEMCSCGKSNMQFQQCGGSMIFSKLHHALNLSKVRACGCELSLYHIGKKHCVMDASTLSCNHIFSIMVYSCSLYI